VSVLGFLLLDYTLYLWHRLNHRVPLLWRFHAVHHIDLDLDTTTGLRFHFGELSMAAVFRAAQVLLLGSIARPCGCGSRCSCSPWSFTTATLAADRGRTGTGGVPRDAADARHPSLTRVEETDSNYSSLLSCWDRLHRSLRLNVAQSSVTIGVQGFTRPEDVTLVASLALPFLPDRRCCRPRVLRD
jgi:sterol desaturase/sphingolipid hydroxylase (fatty acid hydroxylase superfamily)